MVPQEVLSPSEPAARQGIEVHPGRVTSGMPTTRGRPVAGRRGLRPRGGHLRRRVFQRWRSVDHRRSGVYTAVAATASGSNREYVNSLGADEFVDYREQRFETSVAPVHAVIDTVGGTVQQRSLDVLKRDGVLVALPADVPDEVKAEAERRGKRTRYFSVEPNADTLTKISRLVADGRVRPTVSSVYPLAEARAAHEEGRAGHVRGKLVLDATTVAS